MLRRLFVAALLAPFVIPDAIAADPSESRSILVFPFELIDTSLQGEMEGTSERNQKNLQAATARAVALLDASPDYRVVETALAKELFRRYKEQYRRVYRCKSCGLEAAEKAGADLVLVGWVQKVSNLILNMTIRVQDRRSGKVVAGGWISFRGNTKAMWQRATDKLVTTKLLEESNAPSQAP